MRHRRSNPPAAAGAASLQISRHGGDRDHPIPVDRLSVEGDDEKEDRDSVAGISHYSGDRNRPISVEDYHDDVLLQIAIAESLHHQPPPAFIDLEGSEGVKQESRGREGKRPIKEISFIDLDGFGALEHDLDDPRGRLSKRRRFEENPVPEVGESSAAPPTEPKLYCSICMQDYLDFESFSMRGCSHLYCASCVSQYVAAKVEENEVLIGCPDPSCKTGYLELDMCQLILPPKVIDQWASRLCEEILEPMRFYCPYKDCSALLIHEGGINGEVIRESECPHCYRLFCAQCKAPWHSNITCEAYQQLGEDEKGREDLMLMEMAKNQHWQRCPKCKFFVERTEGCNFMRCRCGNTFCYRCAGPMNSDHYCLKCRS
ncbi:probable E3 ubiquitin-protein ligase RNF144A [Phoenix dactylifera]|uniref:RBR-type E3 ubiquitin transferase n=1 Tax=Phoenix dactylifera TaxID=42345 RepID=A0A8B7MV10_PHODC|nr:probable E3 ubiquitin-protein ligase RNF144A [Phoenix dactylifera]